MGIMHFNLIFDLLEFVNGLIYKKSIACLQNQLAIVIVVISLNECSKQINKTHRVSSFVHYLKQKKTPTLSKDSASGNMNKTKVFI